MKHKQLYYFCLLFLIWNLKLLGQQPRLVLPIGHTDEISAAVFSPDGKKILTTSQRDGTVKLWEVNNGWLLANFNIGSKKDDLDNIQPAAFSPDGKKIITTLDNTLKIWNTETGDQLFDSRESIESTILSFSISNNGRLIAIGLIDHRIALFDLKTNRVIHLMQGHEGPVNYVSFSHNDTKLLSTSWDNTIRVWDINQKKELYRLQATGLEVFSSADFSSDDNWILTRHPAKESRLLIVNIWEAGTGKLFRSFNDIAEHQTKLPRLIDATFTPKTNRLLTREPGSVKIWDIKTGEWLQNYPSSYATLSSDEMNLWALDDRENNIDVYDTLENEHATAVIKTPRLKSLDYSWSTGGMSMGVNKYFIQSGDCKKLMTISGYSVYVWDLAGRRIQSILENRIPALQKIEPQANMVFLDYSDNTPKMWDLRRAIIQYNINTKLVNYVRPVSYKPLSTRGASVINDSMVNIWDVASGKIIQTLRPCEKGMIVTDIDLSPDGEQLITVSTDKNYSKYITEVWNVLEQQSLFSLTRTTFLNGYPRFSPDNKCIIFPDTYLQNFGNGFRKDSLINKTLLFTSDNNLFFIDSSLLATFSTSDSLINLYDLKKEILLTQFNMKLYNPTFFDYSIVSDKLLVRYESNDINVGIWDFSTGKLLYILDDDEWKTASVLSPDGKKILTTGFYGIAKIWDSKTGRLLLTFKGHNGVINNAFFTKDNKYIITISVDNTARIWDINSGKLMHILTGHSGAVTRAKLLQKANQLLTASTDNTCKIWNIETGKLIYTFFVSDSIDYFTQIPAGYYQTTSSIAKRLHYVTKNLNVITFEQLDIKYNRPDKVLEAIGNTDTALIKSYRKAWEKRIKKLGIDTTAFRDGYSVPEADFTNRGAIEDEQNTGTLKLFIKGYDSLYKLDRFNVWVNESPVFGQRGISIRKRNKNDFDTTITIKLSQSENRIETSITNVNGTESYRMPLTVNYTPAAKQKETTRFIGIGIDQFADNKYNLQYSAKDIRDLAKKLKEKYNDNIIIDTLFNESVTVNKIKALKQKLLQTTENDKVIIAYSGHGMLSKEYDYYLSTYSVNFDKPEENGLAYDELESLLDSIPARKKLMLIDACHSGEVDKEDLITLNASSDSLIKGLKPVAYKKEGHLGLKNSFELMQSLFVNVGKSTGATIISAAAGTQFALERNDLKNGVFTYSILEAMNKYPTMKISELKKIVGERVEQLTKGLQKPTSRNETIAVDWNVW